MTDNLKRSPKKPRKRRFYKRKAWWLSLLLFFGAAGIVGYKLADDYTRPYRERAAVYDLEKINQLELPSLIVDRNDKEIGRFFVQNRSVVKMDKVPDIFVKALIAGEDSRFRKHHGVDYIGTARALILTWQGSSQGGSTLTQQLARNAYDLKGEAVRRGETTIQRKLVEAFLAMRIEDRYGKQEIMEFYINRVFFGGEFYGLRSASLGYFGKEPMDLSVEECASLVTLLKNPNGLSPLKNPEGNKTWRNFVLKRMQDEGMITKAQMLEYQARPLVLNPQPLRRGTTHLYERISDQVAKLLGEDAMAAGGFKIHTTILAEAQFAAEKALEQTLVKAEARPGYVRPKHADYRRGSGKAPEYVQGAVLMLDHDTGEVLAHVGGRDYAQAPYDFIESGRRSLGTAFFPFLYSMSLSAGQTPGTILEDEAMNNRFVMIGGDEGIVGEWGGEVAIPKYEGWITLRKAFEYGKIAASLRLGQLVGIPKIIKGGTAFGFPLEKAEPLPRVCVGWEQTSMKQAVRAISVFAKGGYAGPTELVYIDRVKDPSGRVVYRRQPKFEPTPQIIDEATAFQVHSMMAGSLDHGTAAGARDGLIQKPFLGAGKGGTTHDFGDTWFLGYNKRITCGVWTGFLQGPGDPIYPGAFSRDLALPIWQAAMNAATPAFGDGEISRPANIVDVPVCSVSGQRATQFCQHLAEDVNTGTMRSVSTRTIEFFRKGTENLPFCSVHSGLDAAGLSPVGAAGVMPSLDVVPVRPQSPVLLGDDPYNTEIPAFAPISGTAGLIRKRTNVLDSFDIDRDTGIILKRPGRLRIEED